jgi:hypothetical protein
MITSFLLVLKCMMGSKGISTRYRFVFTVPRGERDCEVILANS